MIRFLVALWLALGLASSALAQDDESVPLPIRVIVLNSSEQVLSTFTVDSGTAINLTSINNTMRYINVRNNFEENFGPDYDIGRISVNGSLPGSGDQVFIYLGSGSFPFSNPGQLTAVCVDWAGITCDSSLRSKIRLAGAISGNLTNTAQIGEVYRFDVGGQVRAGIETNHAGVGLFRVFAGSIVNGSGATGNITALDGNITIVSTSGDIGGPISASNGNIGQVLSSGGGLTRNVTASGNIDEVNVSGNIGSSASYVSISSGHIIGKVIGARAWANVSTSGSGGQIQRITTTASQGAFIGSISTDHMDYVGSGDISGFSINGDLDADVTFTRYAGAPALSIGGSFPAGRTFGIGEGLASGRTISFGSLGGQLILNASNPTPPNVWSGTVSVNNSALSSQPDYTNTSASIGGGSIGLVPYHLHDEDCVPANGWVGGTPLDSVIRLEWYGPLDWTAGSPVTVEYYGGDVAGWVDISTEFDYAISSTNPRQLEVTPKDLWMDWSLVPYRIQPTSNLKCRGGV
jgi:hypothetical protein